MEPSLLTVRPLLSGLDELCLLATLLGISIIMNNFCFHCLFLLVISFAVWEELFCSWSTFLIENDMESCDNNKILYTLCTVFFFLTLNLVLLVFARSNCRNPLKICQLDRHLIQSHCLLTTTLLIKFNRATELMSQVKITWIICIFLFNWTVVA